MDIFWSLVENIILHYTRISIQIPKPGINYYCSSLPMYIIFKISIVLWNAIICIISTIVTRRV